MIIDVVGFMKVEYDKKTDGSHVKGANIFALQSITSSYGCGQKPVEVGFGNKRSCFLWVSDKLIPFDSLKLGKADVSFNQFGGIDNIVFLD